MWRGNLRCPFQGSERVDAGSAGIPSSNTLRCHVLASSLATRLAYAFQPSGLRTGSPPSPPPHSIRPTVRRLLRSPRLLGPGPRGQLLLSEFRRPSSVVPRS
jgi:hypothetical protein